MENTEENVYFDYIEADGTVKKAEVLTLFTLDGGEKRYALCSVPNADGNFDIMTFIVNENENNEVSFDDILDEKEMTDVTEAANHILSR